MFTDKITKLQIYHKRQHIDIVDAELHIFLLYFLIIMLLLFDNRNEFSENDILINSCPFPTIN